MEDATGSVEPSMLTRPVTLAEYETCHGAIDLRTLRPDVLARVQRRRAEVAELLRDGGELWEWSGGRDFAAVGGLAVIRSGSVIRAWRDWRS
jgi:hypothetical protein